MSANRPLLGMGEVRHRRLRPAVNAFAYPTYFLLLPMRALREQPSAALARNRFGLLSFHDRDHGDGGNDALAWIDPQLEIDGRGLEEAMIEDRGSRIAILNLQSSSTLNWR